MYNTRYRTSEQQPTHPPLPADGVAIIEFFFKKKTKKKKTTLHITVAKPIN